MSSKPTPLAVAVYRLGIAHDLTTLRTVWESLLREIRVKLETYKNLLKRKLSKCPASTS